MALKKEHIAWKWFWNKIKMYLPRSSKTVTVQWVVYGHGPQDYGCKRPVFRPFGGDRITASF